MVAITTIDMLIEYIILNTQKTSEKRTPADEIELNCDICEQFPWYTSVRYVVIILLSSDTSFTNYFFEIFFVVS